MSDEEKDEPWVSGCGLMGAVQRSAINLGEVKGTCLISSILVLLP